MSARAATVAAWARRAARVVAIALALAIDAGAPRAAAQGVDVGNWVAGGLDAAQCSAGSAAAYEPSGMPPRYWGGLGTSGRSWEVGLDAAIDGDEVIALRQRLGVAWDPTGGTDLLAFVLRASTIGAAFDTGRGEHLLRSPIPSISVLLHTPCDGYWLEVGGRFVLPTTDGTTPEEARLGLRATITAGPADDALWIARSTLGGQLFAIGRLRSSAFGFDVLPVLVSIEMGVRFSVGSITVASWLGPQTGVVGSFWAEGFVATANDWNVRLGARAEISLSSLWPSGETLPLSVEGFVGWSPDHAFSIDLFAGEGWLLVTQTGEPSRFRAGTRISFWIP